jgi:hypothetical protein
LGSWTWISLSQLTLNSNLTSYISFVDWWDVNMQRYQDVDALCDRIEGLSEWQRRLMHSVAAARSPDELWCHQPPSTQYRLGISYHQLMQAHAIETMQQKD